MIALESFDRQTIQVQCVGVGLRSIAAWVNGYFAVHQRPTNGGGLIPNEWSVTHLPSGIRFDNTFPTSESAAEAAIEIARLRNDWAVFDPKAVTRDFINALSAIYERYGSFRREPNEAETKLVCQRNYRTDLNGFEGQ